MVLRLPQVLPSSDDVMELTVKSPFVSLSKTAINVVPLMVVTPVIPAQNGRSVSPDWYKEPNPQDSLEIYDHSALAPETRHVAQKLGPIQEHPKDTLTITCSYTTPGNGLRVCPCLTAIGREPFQRVLIGSRIFTRVVNL